jgi:hypothetical protein
MGSNNPDGVQAALSMFGVLLALVAFTERRLIWRRVRRFTEVWRLRLLSPLRTVLHPQYLRRTR